MSVFVDPDLDGGGLRRALYEGHLVVLTRLAAVGAMAAHARAELEALFHPFDPRCAHEHFDRPEMARMLAAWKPRFIHSETSKALVCDIVREAGFPPVTTYYDVPKPRTAFPVGHLTTGIAFAFPWHRDVWYSAPAQQVNWWLPVFPVRDDNAMSFDLSSFDRIVPNTSDAFDSYENNARRVQTAAGVTEEVQARPRAIDHLPPEELVVLPAPGAVLLFSGAQLHRSIPNTSGVARYSVDFRTVDLGDLASGEGAPTRDAHCTGTAIRDFRSVADGREVDEQLVVDLFGAPPGDAMLVFGSDTAEGSARHLPDGNVFEGPLTPHRVI